jgi:electron transport complex, RnfABCDGE type, E subunit
MNAESKQNSYSLSQFIGQLRGGLLDNNPTLVQLLGTCPMLATTTSAKNAIGMGLATTAVLVFSNLFISLIRKLIPQQVRIAVFIVIISGFVTSVEMLIKAFFPALDKSLGVFIPLIVVNCIIIARAEVFASKNSPLPSIVDGFAMGIGFTFALLMLGIVREVLGAGTFFGIVLFGGAIPPMLFFIMPPGAFLTLGFIIAGVHKVLSVTEVKRRKREAMLVLAADTGTSSAIIADKTAASGEYDFVEDRADDGNPEKPAAAEEDNAK